MDKDNILFFNKNMIEKRNLAIKLHNNRNAPVMIRGETGTGKEVLAKIIHIGTQSISDKPFIAMNCAAMPENLFESELFGYEGGAFTGGLSKGKKGKIDLAEGGTLFLDEIGDISLDIQVKLLRFIEEKQFYRVGGLKKHKADIRIIFATNASLEKKLDTGQFREDLYYRLNHFVIDLLPLRERQDDIVPLAQEFINYFCWERGIRSKKISEEAKTVLLDYYWPGNVRQLKNVMHRICFQHDETIIKASHLKTFIQNNNVQKKEVEILQDKKFILPSESFSIENLINQLILQALEKFNGNKTNAARYLGISRRTLYGRLEKMNKQ